MTGEVTQDLLEGTVGKEPLEDFPWRPQADSLIHWCKGKSGAHRAFAFDLLMSLAYVDSIQDIQSSFQHYEDLPTPYAYHLGFINLCSPSLVNSGAWHFQKAAKPKSGTIGKLTSEIILRFIELLHPQLQWTKVIGGVGVADAVLKHSDGRVILSEVKASPLTTFPFLFELDRGAGLNPADMTRTQVGELESALYMHSEFAIPLGKPKGELWPFLPAISFVLDEQNMAKVEEYVAVWGRIRHAYVAKDKASPLYYLANASGAPPLIAKKKFGWPAKESVSDSKTSAGLDRTDDIKKGIYQTMKLGVEASQFAIDFDIRTALISNLPAYRHRSDYVEPFYGVYWTLEEGIRDEGNGRVSCVGADLKRPFDYIIALEDGFCRGEEL